MSLPSFSYQQFGTLAGRPTLSIGWKENGFNINLSWAPKTLYHEEMAELCIDGSADDGPWTVYTDKALAAKEIEELRSYDSDPKVDHITYIKEAEMVHGIILNRRIEDLRNRWIALNLIASIQIH